MASRFPQSVSNYKLTGAAPPDDEEEANVWYYEFPGRLEFHMNIVSEKHRVGHITFTVQRNKLLKPLKRIDPHV